MELENLFGKNHHEYHDYKDDRKSRYRDSGRYSQNFRHSHQRQGTNFKWMYFLEKFKTNRKLKRIVIIAFILILVIVAAIIAIFLPLILKLVEFISQNGVQGLLDYLIVFLDKLWKGSGQ